MSNNKIEIAIALLKLDENYLCLERNKSPFLHTIEFPGGKKKSNESISNCLLREIKEELDILCTKYKYIGSIKHNYKNSLIKINVFKVFKYEGSVSSNENKKIIPYNVNNQTENTLPTHHRILRLLKIPRILKIITKETASDLISTNTSTLACSNIRLRDIDFSFYKSHIYKYLNKINFTGKIIIDYPYNKEWNEPYSGVHFKSKYINKFERLSNNHILASASCHTIAEIEQCNKKLFDFILVSPVIHAHDNKKPLGWEKFNKYSSISLSPCLALGGISKFNEDYKNAIGQQGFGIAGISKV